MWGRKGCEADGSFFRIKALFSSIRRLSSPPWSTLVESRRLQEKLSWKKCKRKSPPDIPLLDMEHLRVQMNVYLNYL